MRSPTTKYKGLKFLMVLAFVIAACIIAVAENGNEDSNQHEVSTTVALPDVNSAVNEDSNQHEVSTTVTKPDMNSAVNKDSNEASTTLQQRMQKTISVDFINTPIEDVIKMIAEQANVDIIKSPTVTGSVTATLTNVPLGEALDNILAVHGYGCLIDKNMISVKPLSEITQQEERTDTKVYHITYADVAQVESALNKFISKRGSISSSKGTSDIIVKDVESNIKAMDSFIEKIDRMTPQVMVEVRIYDITSTEGFDIGAEWSAGRNNPITTFGTNKEDTTVNNLTGATTKDQTDTSATQTTVWQDSDAGLVSGTESYAYRKSKPFVGGSFDADTGGTIRLGLLDTVNVDIALNVLRTQVGAKLLADPRILVLDNETAEFKIISEIPYTEASDTSAGGTLTSTKFKEVGVELKVTPHVTRDGMVRLHIIPEFSVVSELGAIVAGGHAVPTVDSRKADTKALVKDGQTVVIGGLRKRTVSQNVSKIPILGDIPLLGGLFMEVSEEVKTNELLIFITPRIVIEPTLSAGELKGLEATEFGGPKVTYTGDEKAERAEKSEK
jgi:type IV pilus assembly protein PilQ